MRGYRAFTEELARIAVSTGDRRLTELVGRLRAPLSVGVFGRPGVGCRTIARALRAANPSDSAWQVGVGSDSGTADLCVYVIAETVKPEDRAFLAESRPGCVAVLNKADLSGFGGEGPLSIAASRSWDIERQTGIPTCWVAGLLAVAARDERVVDAATIDALRVLAVSPADLGSVDALCDRPHRLAMQIRESLARQLDLFGIALATSAVRGGADAGGVRRLLGRNSGMSALLAALERESAGARYRRIQAAIPRLAEAAAGSAGVHVAELLAADEVVLAKRDAALDVLLSAGMQAAGLGELQSQEAHLREAIFWRTYSRGPVLELHRACAADVSRGALRLWSGGRPPS